MSDPAHPLHPHWQRITWLSVMLLPLAGLFAAVAAVRRLAYRQGWLAREISPVPVIVVGNIRVGGTGKTPLVLWLVEQLRRLGYRPGIISRGYRGLGQCRAVHPDSDPRVAGDEPVLLAARSRCPVWVGARRATAAAALITAHPECNVIVSDDGLQHYALVRDCEIAVVDALTGSGNGWPLPAGPLREPMSRLARCDAVVVNGASATGKPGWFVMTLEGTVLYNLRNPAIQLPAAQFKGRRLHAVAGIGHPARFFRSLESLGLSFTEHAFPDHHPFSASDFDFGDADAIVMTEKDAIKCRPFAQADWWVLPVDAQVDPALIDVVLEKISARGRQTA
jgi:tetraacyldisaccharide 4'-kinase